MTEKKISHRCKNDVHMWCCDPSCMCDCGHDLVVD